jgi:heme-degrading monooxygenase HmoA
MIAREWRCLCPADRIQEFIPYLQSTGVKDAEKIPGFKRAEILYREDKADSILVVLITFWDSIESIKKFAGGDIETAVLYPEDYKYGITSDPEVKHYFTADI